MSEKRCGDCEYFVAFRNMNYETCTNDTITEYCELLQNEGVYDRNKGDEILDNVFDECPLREGFVATKSVIKLLNAKKDLQKQFDGYVHHSLVENERLQKEGGQLREDLQHFVDLLNELSEENEQLKKENIKLKNLRKYCAEWIGVKEESLYDVVR